MIKTETSSRRIKGRTIVVQTKTTHHLDVPERLARKQLSSEITLQQAIADVLHTAARRDVFWFHYATVTETDVKTASKLKAMGIRAGFAKFGFILNGGRCAFLELRSDDDVVSREQRQFRDAVVMLGCNYQVARNVDQAIDILSTWGVIALAGGQNG